MSNHKLHMALAILLMLPAIGMVLLIGFLIGLAGKDIIHILAIFASLIVSIVIVEISIALFKKGWSLWKTSGMK